MDAAFLNHLFFFFCLLFKSRSLLEIEAPVDLLEGNGMDTRESLEFNLALFLITRMKSLHHDQSFIKGPGTFI